MFRPGAGPEFLDPPDMKGEGVIFGKRSPATASLVERTCKVAVATSARPTGNRIWKRKCVFCVGSFLRYQHKTHISVSIYGCQWAVQRWQLRLYKSALPSWQWPACASKHYPYLVGCRSGPERGNRPGS